MRQPIPVRSRRIGALVSVFACQLLACATGGGGGGNQNTCQRPWLMDLSGVNPTQLRRLEGRLYATGGSDGQAWVAEIDRCDGRLLRSVRYQVDGHPTIATDVTWLGEGLLVGGSVNPEGAGMQVGLARLDPAELAVTWRLGLQRLGQSDTGAGIAASGAGRFWLAGTSTGAGAESAPLVVAGEGELPGCLSSPASGPGLSYGVAVHGGSAFVPVVSFGQLVLHRYDAASCGSCPCAPDLSSAFVELGEERTEARGVVATDLGVFVAGMAQDSGMDLFGFVARFDPDSGALLDSRRWDPTPQGDGFLALAADDTHVYLAGGSGWEGEPGFTKTTGALVALPQEDLHGALEERGEAIQGFRLLVAVAADEDAVYVAGHHRDGTAKLLGCPKVGTCTLETDPPEADAGVDAGADAAVDAAVDGGAPDLDAGADAAADAAADASLDAGADAGADAGTDPTVTLHTEPGCFLDVVDTSSLWEVTVGGGVTYRWISVEYEVIAGNWRTDLYNRPVLNHGLMGLHRVVSAFSGRYILGNAAQIHSPPDPLQRKSIFYGRVDLEQKPQGLGWTGYTSWRANFAWVAGETYRIVTLLDAVNQEQTMEIYHQGQLQLTQVGPIPYFDPSLTPVPWKVDFGGIESNEREVKPLGWQFCNLSVRAEPL